MLSLTAAMVVFAALYLLLDSLVRAPRRRGLRLLHLGLVLGGDLLILSPVIGMKLTGMTRRYEDIGAAFALWNWVAMVGYAMTLAGLAVFAVVVLGAIRNRPRSQTAG
jgi:cytochrome c oxidase subunit 1